jgi:hypothetical protein
MPGIGSPGMIIHAIIQVYGKRPCQALAHDTVSQLKQKADIVDRGIPA